MALCRVQCVDFQAEAGAVFGSTPLQARIEVLEVLDVIEVPGGLEGLAEMVR